MFYMRWPWLKPEYGFSSGKPGMMRYVVLNPFVLDDGVLLVYDLLQL